MNAIRDFFDRLEDRVRGRLSHYPIAYAFIAGTAIILYWRGVWHTVDTFHLFLQQYQNASTVDWSVVPWWDGPVSLVVGAVLLLVTGVFVSSFIGNEIIISGLRGEKKMTEHAGAELRHEAGAIAALQDQVAEIARKLDDLRKG